jgi:hypothetical protein
MQPKSNQGHLCRWVELVDDRGVAANHGYLRRRGADTTAERSSIRARVSRCSFDTNVTGADHLRAGGRQRRAKYQIKPKQHPFGR